MTDDDRGFSYDAWRQLWIDRGMPWDSEGLQPEPTNRDPEGQLRFLESGA